uniref:Uncharacterized protein n=1 Tax=Zea mays TaxID=4577 RepID=A0A804Q0X4_MAIZE
MHAYHTERAACTATLHGCRVSLSFSIKHGASLGGWPPPNLLIHPSPSPSRDPCTPPLQVLTSRIASHACAVRPPSPQPAGLATSPHLTQAHCTHTHGGGGDAAAVRCASAAGGGGDGDASASAAAVTVERAAGAVPGGGAGPRGRDRDRLGVPELAAQHVGLPPVREPGEHGAAPRRALLPGAGGPRRLQPRLPLRAPLRRRRLLRHRRRLRPRARAPRGLPRRHTARLHLHRNIADRLAAVLDQHRGAPLLRRRGQPPRGPRHAAVGRRRQRDALRSTTPSSPHALRSWTLLRSISFHCVFYSMLPLLYYTHTADSIDYHKALALLLASRDENENTCMSCPVHV